MSIVFLLVISLIFNGIQYMGLREYARINRAALEPEIKPTEDDAADALLEVVEASLIDEPERWAEAQNKLTHAGGTIVSMQGGQLFVQHGDSVTFVTADWQKRLLHACKSRNSRAMLASFREQK